MAKPIGGLIIFAALTALCMLILSSFWHSSSVVVTVLDIPFTWRLIVAMIAGGYGTAKIA